MHNTAPMPETTTVPLIGAVEAARLLGVSRATVQRRARTGALPPAHVSRDVAGVPCGYLFAPDDVRAYAESIRPSVRVHIIDNLDVSQVECRATHLVQDPERVAGVWSDALVATADGNLAAWDSVELPAKHHQCGECFAAYQAAS